MELTSSARSLRTIVCSGRRRPWVSDLKYPTRARKSERMKTEESSFHFVYRIVILLAVHDGCPAANSCRRFNRALIGPSLGQVRSFIPLPYLVTLAVSHGIRASAHGLQEETFRIAQPIIVYKCVRILARQNWSYIVSKLRDADVLAHLCT